MLSMTKERRRRESELLEAGPYLLFMASNAGDDFASSSKAAKLHESTKHCELNSVSYLQAVPTL